MNSGPLISCMLIQTRP
ncbi:hypothetical protein OIU74_001873, partial [Salix koriyanagi]